ncbi:heme NO-binding domain-containing protein [Roseivivax isoporae]|uniref:Heme NO binding domain-containing protein n=1 Tax=Roseivivax isoporae LMG 25204 TaxID=1449351 RepID=X7F6E3_9RHOB|nr:heme NO-binding domain-containing protein [Roseivivax isoporae]ETX28375.1 heme NO binding domain-containing protein [Roseivivax isoporae LMG 25204]
MLGLVNGVLLSFLLDTYGAWAPQEALRLAGLDDQEFEAMLPYDSDMTRRLRDAAARVLQKPPEAMLEDVGTYLVSHPNAQSIRRLLRFCGTDFLDFLHSLEELPDRVRLAVPDLDLPEIELHDGAGLVFRIEGGPDWPGFGHVLVGLLRAMADDYGALALLEHRALPDGSEEVTVHLVEADYAEGRSFVLGADRRRAVP